MFLRGHAGGVGAPRGQGALTLPAHQNSQPNVSESLSQRNP